MKQTHFQLKYNTLVLYKYWEAKYFILILQIKLLSREVFSEEIFDNIAIIRFCK
jgi:hypothetical protein